MAQACTYCEGPADSVDHVHPRAWGGVTGPANEVPACRSCNSRKGTLPAELVGADWRTLRDYLLERGWKPVTRRTGASSAWYSPDPAKGHVFYSRASALRHAAWGGRT